MRQPRRKSERANGRPLGSRDRHGHAVRHVPADEPNSSFLPIVAQNIRELREENDVSASELANALDVNTATVHSWESGRCVPPLPTVYRIACALGVKPSDIVEVDA